MAAAYGVLSYGLSATLAATAYKDVPAAHWAFDAINTVSDKGLIVGDASGNFRPEALIDKFETAKILAKSAGYKYTNLTKEEQTYYNRAYDKNKPLLTEFQKSFNKWNTTADHEIAFLLEKEILTADDLNQFVVNDTNGVQQLRALSRQEAAVFLVKLMGKKNDALKISSGYVDFEDDDSITPEFKPYIYYLKSLQIISGETSSQFIPNGAVTRASMAILLTKSLEAMKPSGVDSGAVIPVSIANPSVSKVESVSGMIDKLYPILNGIQILTDDKKMLYQVPPVGHIEVDGYLKTFSDLREGMLLSGVLLNNELVNLAAQSVPAAPEVTPAPSMTALTGLVDSIQPDTSGVTIQILTCEWNGEAMLEVKSFLLAPESKIMQSGKAIAFSDIVKGSAVTAEVSGGLCYSLELTEKSWEIQNGVLLNKKMIADVMTLIIQDHSGVSYALRLTDETVVSRKETGKVNWDDLRAGDSVSAVCEYDRLIAVDAAGVKSTQDGVILEVHVAADQQAIVMQTTEGAVKRYALMPETVDVYSVRVGMKVRLNLESQEVRTLTVLENAVAPSFFTGVIESMQTGSLYLRSGSVDPKEIFLDDATVFIDSGSGGAVKPEQLATGMKVYVILPDAGKRASHVTILS
jgi:hypothetical protein